MIEIDIELCKGCELCVRYCPKEVLVMSRKLNRKGYYPPEVADGKWQECMGCRYCELICPEFSISVRHE